MKQKNKRKIIILLAILFILINSLLIITVNNKANTNNSFFPENNEDTTNDINSVNNFKEENLGKLLGIMYEYNPPISPIYVKSINLSSYEKGEDPIISLINTTSYTVNLNKLIQKEIKTEIINNGAPIVLVVHTHGTESFVPDNKNYYFKNTEFNSTDTSKNIVAVGDVFCETLEKNNIPFIHDKTMFDENSYKLAYKNSGIAISEYLQKYPTIKYVIDIHRDTISDKNDIYQKPITIIDGKKTAQIMFVVGTNAGGANHPNWTDNLTVVLKYQEIINEKYPTLARPIYIHTSSFNQYYLPTMMLLEIGASGNTLSEAKNAAKLSAECLVEMINRY